MILFAEFSIGARTWHHARLFGTIVNHNLWSINQIRQIYWSRCSNSLCKSRSRHSVDGVLALWIYGAVDYWSSMDRQWRLFSGQKAFRWNPDMRCCSNTGAFFSWEGSEIVHTVCLNDQTQNELIINGPCKASAWPLYGLCKVPVRPTVEAYGRGSP